MLILLLIALISLVHSLSVSNLYAQKSNVNSVSNYYLTIWPAVQIQNQVNIIIAFPQNYNLTYVQLLNSSLTVNSTNVTCTLPSILVGVSYDFVIPSVINVNTTGSTGLFQVYIYRNGVLVEQNKTAGIIGMGGAEIPLIYPNIYLDSNSSASAGELSQYNFVFSTNTTIPYSVLIYLNIPPQFYVPISPTCLTYSINNATVNTTLVCNGLANNIVAIQGYSNLAINSRISIKVSLVNPNVTGTTSNFNILVYKTSTTYVASSYYNIPGVVIQQGKMYSVSFNKYNPNAYQSISKTMDYLIQFTPKNNLATSNSITIAFPSNFQIVSGTAYDYVQAISGISSGSTSYNTSNIVITNAVVTGQIQIIVRLTNPIVSGTTNNLVISTFSNSILVDQDTSLTTTIAPIASQTLNIFSSFSSIIFNPLFNFASPTTITLSNLNIMSPSCTLNSVSVVCYSLNGKIYIINQTFSASQSYSVGITNANYNPGTYLVDLQLSNQYFTESSTFVITLVPYSFKTAAITLIDNEISSPPNYNRSSIVNISFITDYPITGIILISLNQNITYVYPKFISGIVPKQNQSIIITYTQYTITLSNFNSVTSSTYVQFHLSNVTNPQSSQNLTVAVSNQLYTTYGLVTFDSFVQTLTPTTVATLQYGYTAVMYNFSSTYTNTPFTLQFQPYLNQDISNAIMIIQLPGYDTNFVQLQNDIACQINAIFYPCIAYQYADWILIKNISTMVMSPKPNITIYGLIWPTYADSVGFLVWRCIDQVTLTQIDRKTLGYIIGNTTFPYPNVTSLSYGYLSVTNTAINTPGVNMLFSFETSCLIPNLSVITLNFPSQFSLNSSTPQPSVITPNFLSANSTYPMTYVINTNSIVFSNIKQIPALTTFTVTVQRVIMPNTLLSSTNNFSIVITKNNKLVSSLYNFDTLYYASTFSPDTISSKLYVQTPCVGISTNYVFQLIPYHMIPQYGTIVLTFPYNISFVNCQLSGAISQYSSQAITNNNTLSVTLGSDYFTGSFNVTLYGVINPLVAQNYSYNISTYYSGILIDTNTVNTTIYSVGNTIQLSLSVAPDNEGQLGEYQLKAILSQPADTLTILLSSQFSALASSLMYSGNYNSATLYEFDFLTTNPSSIYTTATLTVVSYKNNILLQKNSINFISTLKPSYLELYNFTTTSYQVGAKAMYSFNFNVPLLVNVALGGLLQIEMDPYFDTTYSQYSLNGISSVQSNSSNLIQLSTATNISGTLNLTIAITNPNVSGNYSFTIRSLLNTSILSETFTNLAITQITIVDIGPTFYVNLNQTLLVYQNTISNSFLISSAYPSRYSFNIVPVASTTDLFIVPSNMIFNSKTTSLGFVVYASVPVGTYKIKWIIQSDEYSSFYNPIVQTSVTILSCPIMSIYVQPINLVPLSGYSLPLQLSIPFIPISPLMITINFNSSDPFAYSPSQIIFSNSTVQYFTINSTTSNQSTSYFVGSNFNLTSNHPNYTFVTSQYTVISQPLDTIVPYISQLNVLSTSTDNIQIEVGTSQICVLHVLVQPWYYSQPQFVNNGFVAENSVFYEVFDLSASVTQTILLQNLTSDSYYNLYCLAIDRGLNLSPLKTLLLNTAPHAYPLEILYSFNQPNLTLTERDSILLPNISFFLSLDSSYVLTPYSSSFFTSPLADTYVNGKYYNPVWVVIPDNYTANMIISELQNSVLYLKKYLNYIIQTTPIVNPVLPYLPSILNITTANFVGYIIVNVTLDYAGTIFISLVTQTLNYAYQIRDLANGTALLTDATWTSMNISVGFNTTYNMYVVSADIGPLYPVLNLNFVQTSVTTLPATPVYVLSISYEPLYLAFVMALVVLV